VDILDPKTGTLTLPNGVKVTPNSTIDEITRQCKAVGIEAARITMGCHPINHATFWWDLKESNGYIVGADFYVISDRHKGSYEPKVFAATKVAHDELLTSNLGSAHETKQMRLTWFDKLLKPRHSLDYVEEHPELIWNFQWGKVRSSYEVREFEPIVYVQWRAN
jgi:hypothetical protein